MDFSKLTDDERLVAWSAIAVVIGGLIAVFSYTTYSGAWFAVIAAAGALAVLFQPQLAPDARVPGPSAVWLLAAGGVAAVVLGLILLVNLGFVFTRFTPADLLFLVAVGAGITMAWAAWRTYAAERALTEAAASAPDDDPSDEGVA